MKYFFHLSATVSDTVFHQIATSSFLLTYHCLAFLILSMHIKKLFFYECQKKTQKSMCIAFNEPINFQFMTIIQKAASKFCLKTDLVK